MLDEFLTNDSILVIPNENKDKIIEDIRSNYGLINIKFMSMKELFCSYYFSYDEKTIYYLINKYNYDYDVCIKYLENLYFINNLIDDNKMKMLIDLKKELDLHNLLYYNKLFINTLKGKNIVFFNCLIDKKSYNLIDDLKKYCTVNIFNYKYDEYLHENVYEFDNIFDEVSYVAQSIIELINKGIDINKIKICGITNEYKNFIKKIFSFYKIPIRFNDNYLYSTSIGKDFLKHLSLDFDESLSYITCNYNMKDANVIDIYNKIIHILNKYIWASDLEVLKIMLIHEFKNTIINELNYSYEVQIIDSLSSYYDCYVFLMNFSQGVVPVVYKNEDYFSDDEKTIIGIDTSFDINLLNYNKWINDIKRCKNIIISYKKHSSLGDFYLSSLNDELNLTTIKPTLNYNYSNIYNKIILTEYIDNLIKYNLCSSELDVLFNNYKDISYRKYNNKYSLIDKNKLKKYLNNNLVLSYSAINNYYHCAFKYYLSNVLKLNIFEESFYIIIGNVFHYILSICFNGDVDLYREYNDYLDKQKYIFNEREKFFLNKLFSELIFVINTIKKQYSYSSLNNFLYEEEITIDKSKEDMLIIFKGFIDKIIMDDNFKYAAIVDYKTGNPSLDLNNSIYGIDLQLPVYVYLLKNKYPNIRIVGFYLQKILNGVISCDNKKDYNSLKEDRLKLQGYTNNDENLISLFDSNYYDSNVIKGMKTSSKGISSKKVLSDDDIIKLYNITEDKINLAIDNILDCDFSINPKRVGSDNLGCMFCKYKDVCFMNESDVVNLDVVDNVFDY